MPYFPQVFANATITQLPYETTQWFDTISQDMETGMRWTFSRTANNIPGYPTKPTARFGVNFSNITDDEISKIDAFFRQMRGRWGQFGFLDPGGNLVQYSEDFSNAYWDKSNGPITIGSTSVTDPFGGALATALVGGGTNAYLTASIAPTVGEDMTGWVLCASAWVKSPDVGAELRIGFIDASFTTFRATNWSLPQNRWIRISHREPMWSSGEKRMVVGGFGAWAGGRTINMFGAQVVPMKGEGAYVRTPDNYGFHSHCRFDTDSLAIKMLGPNFNALTLPIAEINI